MAYRRITAAEAAEMIKDRDTLALSGFTPNGNPKAIFRELSKRAIRLHEQGEEFGIGILTGASSCQSVEGDMAAAKALRFRAPFSTNKDFRTHTNLGEVEYEDMHLGHMAERLRRGFYGEVDWAVIEVSDMEEGETECKAFLTSAGGIVTTIARIAKKIIIEHNQFHNPNSRYLHDTWEPREVWDNREVMDIHSPYDRIGKDYVSIDPKKIVGVIESNIPEEARAFREPDEGIMLIGQHVADLLANDMKVGRIPKQFLPVQSGVGATGNAVLKALGTSKLIPRFNVYSEVVQDAAINYMLEGRIGYASATAMTVTNEALHRVYDNMDYFSKHLTIRQSEIANSPEVIRRLGVIAINTPLECDIYGNENSSHICGSALMNGIGGSCDYERNGYISIFTTPSTAKDGAISAIVPMVSHMDHSEHSVKILITENGIADLRGKSPIQRAHEIIENCVADEYKDLLRSYLKTCPTAHTPHNLHKAFNMHEAFAELGDMRKATF